MERKKIAHITNRQSYIYQGQGINWYRNVKLLRHSDRITYNHHFCFNFLRISWWYLQIGIFTCGMPNPNFSPEVPNRINSFNYLKRYCSLIKPHFNWRCILMLVDSLKNYCFQIILTSLQILICNTERIVCSSFIVFFLFFLSIVYIRERL